MSERSADDRDPIAFVFIPQGDPEPTEWMKRHPGWIRIPASFVPGDSGGATVGARPSNGASWPTDAAGRDWPKDRFGRPYRPLWSYGAGERAPGEIERRPFAAGAVENRPYLDQADGRGDQQVDIFAPPQPRDTRGSDVASLIYDRMRPVPLIDDTGQAVLNADGKPVMRPAGLNPHVFVNAGREIGKYLSGDDFGGATLGQISADLAKFRQGGLWDAQRLDGHFHQDFRDYATIAIGLYAAAAGINVATILTIENDYAAEWSSFSDKRFDPVYRHLPEKNVNNTLLGNKLFQSGRIGPGSTGEP